MGGLDSTASGSAGYCRVGSAFAFGSQAPGTDLIEIRVYGRSPAECAQLANEIAETGVRQARHGSGPIRIVEQAVPPPRPSRPNKPLNLALGAVVGIFLGTMAGGVGAKLAVGVDGPRSTSD